MPLPAPVITATVSFALIFISPGLDSLAPRTEQSFDAGSRVRILVGAVERVECDRSVEGGEGLIDSARVRVTSLFWRMRHDESDAA